MRTEGVDETRTGPVARARATDAAFAAALLLLGGASVYAAALTTMDDGRAGEDAWRVAFLLGSACAIGAASWALLRRALPRARVERARALLSLVATRSGHMVTVLDASGRVLWANGASLRRSAATRRAVVGQEADALIDAELTDPGALEAFRAGVERREPFVAEVVRRSAGAEAYWVRVEGIPAPGGGGKMILIETEVTAQYRADRDRRRLALAATMTPSLVVACDEFGAVEWVNEAFTRATGRALADVAGRRPDAALVHPSTDPRAVKRLGEAIAACRPFDGDVVAPAPGGGSAPCRVACRPIPDEDGRPAGTVVVATPEPGAARACGFAGGVLDALGAEVAVLDARGRVLAVNARWAGRAAEATRAVGADYLAACLDEEGGAELAEGILLVLAGETEEFVREGGSIGPGGERRRRLTRVTPFPDGAELRVVVAHEDVTRLREAEEGLRWNRELLEQTGRMAKIGGWRVDASTMAVRWSPEVYRIHELDPGETLDVERAVSFYRDDARPVIRGAVERALETGEGWDLELPLVTARGREIWVRAIGSAETVGGRRVGLAGVFQDVTDRRAARERLERAMAEAEGANRAKTEFLANMSHEIRTPMAAILGYADLLSDAGYSDDERSGFVRTIKRNGDHLMALLDDILDISKIEAGRMTVESMSCSPARIVADVESIMRVRARQKGLGFGAELVGPVPESIRSDPTRLRQILLNLVGNAIKFTERGGVRVLVELATDASDPDPRLRFEVADTGIGIEPGDLAEIFKPFSQADTSVTRRFGGTGLGLTISRRLAAMLGGELEATSVPGEGSRFGVTVATGPLEGVPMARAGSAPERPPAPAPAAPTPRLRARVLLVEDGPDNQRLLEFYLTRAGASVELAENGLEGVRLALEAESAGRPFDLVLMDMQMPELDGYGAARRLRDAGFPRPVVALTAHAMAGDRERCLEAGCDDYLTKPVDRAELLRRCAAIVGDRRAAA